MGGLDHHDKEVVLRYGGGSGWVQTLQQQHGEGELEQGQAHSLAKGMDLSGTLVNNKIEIQRNIYRTCL